MRKILLSILSLVALATLVGCGGGGSSNITPVPSGPTGGNNAGFSNSSLSGSYVFSVNGVNSSNSFAVIGSFVADGAGNITSGTRDTVTDGGGQALSESITGTYTVNQDGRGQATLNGTSGRVIYRFVMQSPSAAKLFQISDSADATGRIIAQPSFTSTALTATSTYIVRLDGEDSGLNVYGAIGGLTFTGGSTITGTVDENDNATFNAQFAGTGSFSAPATSGRGTATLITATGTHNFVYYLVSPARLELISTDRNFFLHGYADQQTAIAGTAVAFVGDQVFNISGYDSSGQVLETGRLTLDGVGNLTNAIEDYNEAGSYYDSVPFTGTYSVAANGRWTATLTYTSSTLSFVGWQVSPQQSMVLVSGSNIANFGVVETGTMRAQTIGLTTASVTGNYADNLSGLYINSGNIESGGNFLADGSGNLNGTIDSQTPTSINTDIVQSGNYSVAANGRSSGTIGAVPVHVYTVDADTIYLISTDPNRLYQGMLVKQQ